MFIVALLVIIKNCKQSKHPSTGRERKTVVPAYNGIMDYGSGTLREQSMDTCSIMDEFQITLSAQRQTQKLQNSIYTTFWRRQN